MADTKDQMSTTDISQIESGQSSSNSSTHSPHKWYSEQMNNIIIGFSDGLTVPFALTAGLSATGSIKLVVMGGLAELFAGAISMGIGAWLAAETDRQSYEKELAGQIREARESPGLREDSVYDIFARFHVPRESCRPMVESLSGDEEMWVQFMMLFSHHLQKPETGKSSLSGIVMGMSYLIGGLLPMIPYFAYKNVYHALFTSIGISVVVLLGFGYAKAHLTGLSRREAVFSAVQTLAVGALAAGTSYGIVRGLDRNFRA